MFLIFILKNHDPSKYQTITIYVQYDSDATSQPAMDWYYILGQVSYIGYIKLGII